MELKWIGVDCGSADHPMNTIIRNWHPARFLEAEAKLKQDHGQAWDEMFPPDVYYQVMHLKLFPKKLVHAENLGGEIDRVSNQRVWIGCFRCAALSWSRPCAASSPCCHHSEPRNTRNTLKGVQRLAS